MFVYEIKQKDIGKTRIVLKYNCYRNKEFIDTGSFMGKILPCDVNKRIYKRGEIYQVENKEQLQRRIKQ